MTTRLSSPWCMGRYNSKDRSGPLVVIGRSDVLNFDRSSRRRWSKGVTSTKVKETTTCQPFSGPALQNWIGYKPNHAGGRTETAWDNVRPLNVVKTKGVKIYTIEGDWIGSKKTYVHGFCLSSLTLFLFTPHSPFIPTKKVP